MSNFINANLTGRLSVGQGERGKSLEYEWRGTKLGIRVEGEEEYSFVDLVGSGADGREIELIKADGVIKWRYKGQGDSEDWQILVPLDELKGDKGIYVGSRDTAPLEADIVIDDSDEGLYMNELIETPIKNSILNLTLNKYQTTTMEDNTTIILPHVDKFTEIHLFFSTENVLTLTFPSIAWKSDVSIESGKIYHFIFTYTDAWLGEYVSYTNKNDTNNGLKPVKKGLVCWLDARDFNGTNVLKDRSGNGNDFKLNGQFDCANGFLSFSNKKNDYAENEGMSLDWDSVSIQMRVSNVANSDSYLFSSGGWNGINIRYRQTAKTLAITKHAGRCVGTKAVDLTSEDVIISAKYSSDKLLLKCDGMEDVELNTDMCGSKIFNKTRIGSSATAVAYLASMKFGSILIYNRVLTEAEIKQNYDYEKSIQRDNIMYARLENNRLVYAPKNLNIDNKLIINFNQHEELMKLHGFKRIIDIKQDYDSSTQCLSINGYEENEENITINYEINDMEINEESSLDLKERVIELERINREQNELIQELLVSVNLRKEKL